jgi:hypothetical protein
VKLDIYGMIPILDIENKHYDIVFLERRLLDSVIKERYEVSVRLSRWIRELAYLHHGIKEEELYKFIKVY